MQIVKPDSFHHRILSVIIAPSYAFHIVVTSTMHLKCSVIVTNH